MKIKAIELVEAANLRDDVPDFRVGDRVEVHQKILDGAKERIQIFEGDVIARHNGGVRETFTVRRIVQGEGVERIFPVHSPRIAKIEVKKAGLVRRAKLYYLRDRVGKATKIRDDVKRQTQDRRRLKSAAESGRQGGPGSRREGHRRGRHEQVGPEEEGQEGSRRGRQEEVNRQRPVHPGRLRWRRRACPPMHTRLNHQSTNPASPAGPGGGAGSAAAANGPRPGSSARFGYRVLAANVSDSAGELDLLALDGETLVVVEVRSTAYDTPRPWTTPPLRSTSASNGESPMPPCASWPPGDCSARSRVRFDIIVIGWPSSAAEPTIRHFPNAFEAVGKFQMFS